MYLLEDFRKKMDYKSQHAPMGSFSSKQREVLNAHKYRIHKEAYTRKNGSGLARQGNSPFWLDHIVPLPF